MEIPSRRVNTPYVYMTKHGTGATPFTLYVYIAIYEGTTVSGPAVMLPTILFTITGTATSTNIVHKYFRGDLAEPPASTNAFDEPDLSVEVKKSQYLPPAVEADPDKYGDREVTLQYRDADLQAPIPGDVAFNCPYTYLTNPSAILGLEVIDFAGRCHVPLQGCDYDPALQTPMVNSTFQETNSPQSGEQEVKISPLPASTKTEVNPIHIDCNQEKYLDANIQTGFFEVTVTQPPVAAAAPPRKSKLRNRSSDTHPNGFVG